MHPVALRALARFDELFPERTSANAPDAILHDIATFRDFGTSTISQVSDNIPYLINEFWTSGQRRGHSIHEISYRACFKPQLPEFFIKRLTVPGDTVLDPFMGRGTTPVQASLMSRHAIANDINPLSILLTRPRLSPPTLAEVGRALAAIDWHLPVVIPEDLLAFYHPETLRHLCILRNWLLAAAPPRASSHDPVVDWIRMVAINRLTGHSPGFFSVYTLPPNQAVSVNAQRKINEKRQQVPPFRDLSAIILKKSRSLLADGKPCFPRAAVFLTGHAADMPAIADASVALVVTSPPFLDIVQYAEDNWLRCWFAGIDVSSIAIAMHRTEAAWRSMVGEALAEMARVVRPGGHVAFEVGEVRGGKVLLEKLVWQAAADLPFDRLAVIINQQNFTKTANCWGVSNNRSGTNTNRIVLLRRR